MKLEQTFDVKAPVQQVWAALIDLERVAPCLPGAQITGRDEEGTYHGTFQVKLGPTTAAYRGTIRIDAADEATRTATLKARGTDKRGQGGASATIVNVLSEHDGGTRVAATTDFTITGRLARFGRGGMMQDISNRLLRDFAACLATRLADGPEAAPGGAATAAPPAGEAAAGAAIAPDAAAVDEGRSDVPPGEQGDVDAGNAAATPPPAPPPPAAVQPVKGGSLFLAVVWERIRRLFRRG